MPIAPVHRHERPHEHQHIDPVTPLMNAPARNRRSPPHNTRAGVRHDALPRVVSARADSNEEARVHQIAWRHGSSAAPTRPFTSARYRANLTTVSFGSS